MTAVGVLDIAIGGCYTLDESYQAFAPLKQVQVSLLELEAEVMRLCVVGAAADESIEVVICLREVLADIQAQSP